MIIKVCGMRNAANIKAAEEAGADWIGFIFHKDSPRFVSMYSSLAGIIPDYAPSSLSRNDKDNISKRVGVFVDDMPQTIVTMVVNFHLDMVQLHGNESRIMIENLRRTIEPDIHPGLKIIKAISISSKEDVMRYKEYEVSVDYLLFDTKCATSGGSGKHFDWSVLEAYDGNTPFLLSGGIGPEDIDNVKAFRHPMMAGIDLNSKFETEPGIKDIEKLKLFIRKIRNE